MSDKVNPFDTNEGILLELVDDTTVMLESDWGMSPYGVFGSNDRMHAFTLFPWCRIKEVRYPYADDWEKMM